uniref:Transmembrane protein 107 n=1 Tax=Pseudonaja textilis TaxID=8673 RepID=A0A670ZVP9_PSETE
MPLVSGLVPSRFLVLTAHLVIVITIFWSRENNVRASLPLQCTPEEYARRDTEMVVALSVTLGLFAIELAGFLSGVSMFNNIQSLFCILLKEYGCWKKHPSGFSSKWWGRKTLETWRLFGKMV